MIKKIFVQFQIFLPIIIRLFISVITLFFICVLIVSQTNMDLDLLTRDPAASTGTNPLTGMVSNLGILLWCICASLCFFSFTLLKNKPFNREFSSFFLLSGCLTSILLLDDLFMLHEHIFPLNLNIPEKLVIFVYGIIVFLYLAKFRKLISKTDFIFLFLAFGFFGASIIIDLLVTNMYLAIFEDWFKLLGIVNWLAYFTRVCFQQVERNVRIQRKEREKVRTSM